MQDTIEFCGVPSARHPMESEECSPLLLRGAVEANLLPIAAHRKPSEEHLVPTSLECEQCGSAGTMSSEKMNFPPGGEALAEGGRTSRAVFEDLFYTFTGCRRLADFFSLQHAGAKLRHNLASGANFTAPEVQPVVPPQLLTWLREKEHVLSLSGMDDSVRHLLKLGYDHRSPCRSAGNVFEGTRAAEYSVCPMAHDGPNKDEVPLLLSSLDELPEQHRCAAHGLHIIRQKVNAYFVQLAKLIMVTKAFSGRWGQLRSSERQLLAECMEGEKSARIESELDMLQCFEELNFTGERLDTITEDIGRCNKAHTLQICNNPLLTDIPCVPPQCHTFIASACSIHRITLQRAARSVCVLGLAFNKLDDLNFLSLFPMVRMVDVSFNRIGSMEDAITQLKRHTSILEVYLKGNPISYVDDFRRCLAMGVARLEKVDGQLIAAEERALCAPAPSPSPPLEPNGGRRGVRRAGARRKGAEDNEPKEPVELPGEKAMRQWKISNTISAAVECLSLTGLVSLTHIPPSITSEEDLRPSSELMQRAAGLRDGKLSETCANLRAMIQQLPPAANPSKKQNAGKTPSRLPLYESTSTLLIHGHWGSSAVVELTLPPMPVDPPKPLVPPPTDSPRDARTSPQRAGGPPAAAGSTSRGRKVRLSHAGETLDLPVGPPEPPRMEAATVSFPCGVSVDLGGIPLNPEPVVVGGKTGAAAAARLRKAIAAAATTVIEDRLDYQGSGEEKGRFQADLPLRHSLREELGRPLRLEVEVKDELRFRDYEALMAALEGGGVAQPPSGAPRGRGKSMTSKRLSLEVVPESQKLTLHRRLGTITIDVSELIDQDSQPPFTSPTPGSEPSCCREVFARQVPLAMSAADFVKEEYHVLRAQKQLRQEMEAYIATQTLLEESRRNEERNAMAAAVAAANNAAAKAASRRISQAQNPAAKKTLPRKLSTSCAAVHSLQAESTERKRQVTEMLIRTLALQHRLEELRAAHLHLDVKLSLGRGPSPPLSAEEAKLQQELLEKALAAKGPQRGRQNKGLRKRP